MSCGAKRYAIIFNRIFTTIGLPSWISYDINVLPIKFKRRVTMAEVNVRKKDSGKWEFRVELAPIDGKRQQKSKGGFSTKSEALKAGRKFLEEYESGGQVIVNSKISFSDLLDTWISEVSKTDLQQTTVDGYSKKIKLYIKPAIGHYKIGAISRLTLQEFITNMSNQGYSRNTVSSVRGIITSAFDWAELNKMISYSPAYRLKLPRKTAVKQRTSPHVYITDDQLKQIYLRFPKGTTNFLPMKLAEHTGLRLGECYAIVWDDIDFENKTLTVNRQIQWFQDKTRSREEKIISNGSKNKGGGFWYFTTPKYNSYRIIELDNEIIKLLKEEKEKQRKAKIYYDDRWFRYFSYEPINQIDSLQNRITQDLTENEVDFLFRRESGEYITPRTMQHTSYIIHHRLDFPEFDFHSFRHTHATKLREHKVSDVYIQYRLGHAKLDTTMQIYANHLTKIDVDEGVRALNELY